MARIYALRNFPSYISKKNKTKPNLPFFNQDQSSTFRNARQMLEGACQMARIGGWELNLQTQTLYWSSVTKEIHGVPPHYVPDLDAAIHFYKEGSSREQIQTAVELAIRTGESFDLVLELLTANGEVRWVHAKGQAEFDKQGVCVCIFGTFQDINEQKIIEEQLQQTIQELADFKNAIQNSSIVSMADKTGLITYVNENFIEISGYSKAELLGQNHRIINSGHHPPEFWVEMWKTIAKGKVWRADVKNKAKDGSYYWVDTFVMPFLDEKGEIKEFLSIRNDISQRKQTEEQLQQTIQELADFKNAIQRSSIVSMADKTGLITYVNDNFIEISGYSKEELLGQNHRIVNSGHHPPEFWVEMWKTIATGKVWRADVKNKAKDGSYYWVDTFVMPFLDEKGKIKEFLSIRNDISQRKAIEEELQQTNQSLADFRNAIQRSSIVSMADKRGNITYVNENFIEISGYSKEELLGQNHRIVNSGYHPPAFWTEMWKTITKGFVWRGEVKNKAKDGSYYWVDTFIMPFLDKNREVKAFLSIRNDISQRKTIEEELQQSNRELADFKNAIQNSSIVSMTDKTGIITYVNENFVHISGYSEAELLGQNHRLINSGHHPPAFWVEMWKTISKGNIWRSEIRNKAKDGSYYWVDAFILPFLDEDGRVKEYLSIRNDITRSKNLEEELYLNKRVLESANEGILITDLRLPDNPIVFANQGFFQLTGYEESEILGKNCRFLQGKDTDEQTVAQIRACVEQHQNFKGEILNYKKNGEPFWNKLSITPVANENGEITHFIGIQNDITNRKMVEAELQLLNNDLESRVNQRTFQLQAINKELEAFSYSVSHDLRSPLRGIDGWSLALLEDYGYQMDAQATQYLGRIRNEVQRMGNLIDDVIKLAQIGRLELQPQQISLSNLAETIVQRLREEESKRQFEITIQANLVVQGDYRSLEIMLTNLLSNAVKFTNKRPVAMIEFGQQQEAGRNVFFIRDNGVGFNMDYAQKIFGAFQRMHKQSEFPGTGIGLAIVQRIINLHKGQIWVQSAVNQGTTFYFTLP